MGAMLIFRVAPSLAPTVESAQGCCNPRAGWRSMWQPAFQHFHDLLRRRVHDDDFGRQEVKEAAGWLVVGRNEEERRGLLAESGAVELFGGVEERFAGALDTDEHWVFARRR